MAPKSLRLSSRSAYVPNATIDDTAKHFVIKHMYIDLVSKMIFEMQKVDDLKEQHLGVLLEEIIIQASVVISIIILPILM